MSHANNRSVLSVASTLFGGVSIFAGTLLINPVARATEGTPVPAVVPTTINNGEVIASPVNAEHGGNKSDNSEDPCGPNRSPNSENPTKKSQLQKQCQGQGQGQTANGGAATVAPITVTGAPSTSSAGAQVKDSGNSRSDSKSSGTGIGVGGSSKSGDSVSGSSATGGTNGDQTQKTGILIAPSDNSTRVNTTEIDARVDGRSTPVQQSTVSSPDTTRVNALVCNSQTGTWLPVEILATSNGPRATNTQGGFSVFGGLGAHAGRSKSDTSDIGRKNAEFAQLSSVFAQSQFWQSGDSATAGLAGKYLAQRAGLPVADAEEIGSAFKSAPKVVCGAKPPTSFGPPPYNPPVTTVTTYGCFKQPDGSFAIEATKGRQPLARKVCMEKPF